MPANIENLTKITTYEDLLENVKVYNDKYNSLIEKFDEQKLGENVVQYINLLTEIEKYKKDENGMALPLQYLYGNTLFTNCQQKIWDHEELADVKEYKKTLEEIENHKKSKFELSLEDSKLGEVYPDEDNIPDGYLSEELEEIQYIANLIKDNKFPLVKLSISSDRYSEEEGIQKEVVLEVGKALEKNTTLQEFVLSGFSELQINEEVQNSEEPEVEGSEEEAEISEELESPEESEAEGSEEVEELFTKNDLEKFIESLNKNRNLRTLTIKYSQLDDNFIEPFIQGLSNNKSIYNLNIEGNTIGKKGLAAIKEMLKKPDPIPLVTLNIGSHNGNKDDVKNLFDGVPKHSFLQNLNISYNQNVSKDDVESFVVDMIRNNNTAVKVNDINRLFSRSDAARHAMAQRGEEVKNRFEEADDGLFKKKTEQEMQQKAQLVNGIFKKQIVPTILEETARVFSDPNVISDQNRERANNLTKEQKQDFVNKIIENLKDPDILKSIADQIFNSIISEPKQSGEGNYRFQPKRRRRLNAESATEESTTASINPTVATRLSSQYYKDPGL